MVFDLAEKGMTTGAEQEQKQIDATKINAQRIRRIEKTGALDADLLIKLKALKQNWIWLVLTESWCGDGAQNIPYIAKMADASEFIDLRFILRDEHPEVMNEFLTNGTRSVPKLICINADTGELLGTWGPRAENILKWVSDFRSNNPEVPHEKFLERLHGLYAQDKGGAMQKDFFCLLDIWMGRECVLKRSA